MENKHIPKDFYDKQDKAYQMLLIFDFLKNIFDKMLIQYHMLVEYFQIFGIHDFHLEIKRIQLCLGVLVSLLQLIQIG